MKKFTLKAVKIAIDDKYWFEDYKSEIKELVHVLNTADKTVVKKLLNADLDQLADKSIDHFVDWYIKEIDKDRTNDRNEFDADMRLLLNDKMAYLADYEPCEEMVTEIFEKNFPEYHQLIDAIASYSSLANCDPFRFFERTSGIISIMESKINKRLREHYSEHLHATA